MVDRTVKKPMCISYDFLVKMDKFFFLDNFVVLDYDVGFEIPIILVRTLLAMGRTLVDMEKGELKFRMNDDAMTSIFTEP